MKSFSSSFLTGIPLMDNQIRETTYNHNKDSAGKMESINHMRSTIASLSITTSAVLFCAFLLLSSTYYCLIFLWKSPLDGLHFTGMTFSTIGSSDTVPEASINIFLFCYFHRYIVTSQTDSVFCTS